MEKRGLKEEKVHFKHVYVDKFEDGMHIMPKEEFQNQNKNLRNSHITSMVTMANSNDQTVVRTTAHYGPNSEENLGSSEIANERIYFEHIIV